MAFQRAQERPDPTAHHSEIASSLFPSSSLLLQIDIIISQSFSHRFPSFRTHFISTLRTLSCCSIRSRLRRRVLAQDPGLSLTFTMEVSLCHQDISLSILCCFSLSRSHFRLFSTILSCLYRVSHTSLLSPIPVLLFCLPHSTTTITFHFHS